jgi:hypothetical protein
LVCKRIGWSVGKSFQKQLDGRVAFLAIKEQAEAKAAVDTTKTKAYALIRDARYKGNRFNFEFQNNVQIHQDARIELLKEPIPEKNKVSNFLVGIIVQGKIKLVTFWWGSLTPAYRMGKTSVLVMTSMADFQLCQTFLSSLVHQSLAEDRLQRKVSYTSTEGWGGSQGRGRGNGGQGRGQGNGGQGG